MSSGGWNRVIFDTILYLYCSILMLATAKLFYVLHL